MHFRDIAGLRNTAGADRPYRFIGNRQPIGAGTGGKGPRQLHRDNLDGLPRIAFLFGFSDTDNTAHAGGVDRLGLGLHLGIALLLIGPAFAVAEDRIGRARFLEHRRRQAPCMRAALGIMAILRANGEAGIGLCGRRDQCGRRTDTDIGTVMIGSDRGNGSDIRKLRAQSVHFPVADNIFPVRHDAPAFLIFSIPFR